MHFGYGYLLFPFSNSASYGTTSDTVETDTTQVSSTTDAPNPVSTVCGDIITYANEDLDNNFLFDAYSVHECLTSVPFHPEVATRFIDYYNTTIQFQSTLAYLKNPPSTYQQPAIDVVAALGQIQQNVTQGLYNNQYEFEATVQSLIYSMHDSHVSLSAGALSAFSFGSPYDLVTASVDGKQAPQVYLKDDVIDSQTQGWTPSPVVQINDEDVVEFLQEFARVNSMGMLEDHAEWNQLMFNPVQDILGTYNIFGWTTTFYPGDELKFTLANGTVIDSLWLAFYLNFDQTGPLTTGGDFYNYFVLGLLPASQVEQGVLDDDVTVTDNSTTTDDGSSDNSGDDGSQSAGATSWNDESPAFPANPDVYQPGLAIDQSGFLTGYFYHDISTAVLSIPSFDEYGDDIGTFSNTTANFIQQAQDAGLNHVVIDLSQNGGGATLLAIDTFKQFFPNIDPYAGSRRRSHLLGNVMGEAMTDFWDALTPDGTDYDYDTYYYTLAANEFVITDRLNAATGQNFTSWEQYAGPILANGDSFSLIERYNFSSGIFDAAAFGGYAPAGYDGSLEGAQTPWNAENIVLLTDGTCGSTCSLFVELMTHQAGVRTVAIGGVPKTGPMQAASGSRGASAYTADLIDANMVFAGAVNDTANTTLPAVRDPGMYVFTAGINLRDQMREGDDIPLQFQYAAADCRMYYTLANVYNMTRLWRDAALATWNDTSLCVTGSMGYATAANATTTPKGAPQYSAPNGGKFDGINGAYEPAYAEDFGDNTLQDDVFTKQSGSFGPCQKSTCASLKCAVVKCPNNQSNKVCQPPCNNIGGPCSNGEGVCMGDTKQIESKAKTASGKSGSYSHQSFLKGYCVPRSSKNVGCLNVGRGQPGVPQ